MPKAKKDLLRAIRQDGITVCVSGCARCGRDHARLYFKPLTRPIGRLTHWALCPHCDQPILMRITDDGKDKQA